MDWYPWGEEAFAKARQEDKPVFLSIGYSTCHWCHVMERESFEDPRVAGLINDAFVPVKVDREERPDIDHVYMNVCQLVTGQGGWPLTLFLTPEKKPFFAATYIPRESRFGRTGLIELIPRIDVLWREKRGELLESAEKITEALRRFSPSGGDDLAVSHLDIAYRNLAGTFDEEHGGFGTAPKFPTPHHLTFLLRYWKRTGNERAFEKVEKTLGAMRRGGICDQVGFGFHRYSTDEKWLLPHFEKMLSDQAQLAIAYLEAYQAGGKDEYARAAREIFAYVLRDLTGPEGGFWSAEDADSEGEEGKYYLWTLAEVRDLLGREEAETAARVFNLEEGGNFFDPAAGGTTGKNIPHLRRSIPELAQALGIPDLEERVEGMRRKLFDGREKRIRPHRDDKVLTDWNGLMIAAFARGARVLAEPEYRRAAEKAAAFIGSLTDEKGRLPHRYRDGQAGIAAHLDDYAFYIWGLIELYQAGFEVGPLRRALTLTDEAINRFWDERSGGFFSTAADAEVLLVRPKEIYDGATPSGNSVMAMNLIMLGRMCAKPDYEEKASRLVRAFSATVAQMPQVSAQFLQAVDFAIGPSCELVIAGRPGAKDTREMIEALRMIYVPDHVIILRPTDEENPAITEIAEFTRDQRDIGGRAAAYVCRNNACEQPVTDPGKMVELLRKNIPNEEV